MSPDFNKGNADMLHDCDFDEMLDEDFIDDEESKPKMVNQTEFTSGKEYLDDEVYDSSKHKGRNFGEDGQYQ